MIINSPWRFETTGYAQEEGWQGSSPPKPKGDWDEVWARVTYENVMRRYPRIIERLGSE